MKINVFGLGYVGNVTALSLTAMGHDVTGIEVVKEKVKLIQNGKLPIYEPGLEDLLHKALAGKLEGRFRVQSELPHNFQSSDGSLVCVGTPSLNSGQVDLSQIEQTVRAIGKSLKNTKRRHEVIIRSTIPPGTMEEMVIPLLESESKRKAGKDFGVGFYPEFLREGTSLADFSQPSLNVIGCLNDQTLNFIKNVFIVNKEAVSTEIRTAEMIKYVNNSFHALKVAFANEVGTLCRAYGVNTDELIQVFLSDKVLNISPYYLRPGFAFGGACLPKEVRATSELFLKKGIKAHLIHSIIPSNEEHINRVVSLIQNQNVTKVAFLGVSFKPDTDDIRESSLLKIVGALLHLPSYKKKLSITICDRASVISKVKKEFVSNQIDYQINVSKVLSSKQMIILGSYRLQPKEILKLKKYKGIIVDLKWFNMPEEIKSLKGYCSIVNSK